MTKEEMEEIASYVAQNFISPLCFSTESAEEIYLHMSGNEFNKFVDALNNSNSKVWIRQVIIPGINDTEEYILKLKEYIKKIKNVEKIELLPYHTMGVEKYKKLNINYPLEGVEPLDKDKLEQLKKILD